MKTKRVKKWLLTLLLFISLFVTAFSSIVSNAEVTEIPFRYLYRGFTPVSLADTGKRAAFSTVSSGGAWLIKEEETLFTFCNNFCPGVPFYEEYDFSRDDCEIKIQAAKNGQTTALVKGLPLHSKYDPLREAESYLSK